MTREDEFSPSLAVCLKPLYFFSREKKRVNKKGEKNIMKFQKNLATRFVVFLMTVAIAMMAGSFVGAQEEPIPGPVEVLEVSLSPETPAGGLIKSDEYKTITVFRIQNWGESQAAVIDTLIITRYGSARDSDVNWASIEVDGLWMGNVMFQEGRGGDLYYPILVNPSNYVDVAVETEPLDEATHLADFSFGIASSSDIGVEGFEIMGAFPIIGNTFIIDNPPQPGLEVWADRYEYKAGDSMTVTGNITNPTELDSVFRVKCFLMNEDWTPVKGTIKTIILMVPAGGEKEEILFQSKYLTKLLSPGHYYYWQVYLYSLTGTSPIDSSSVSFKLVE